MHKPMGPRSMLIRKDDKPSLNAVQAAHAALFGDEADYHSIIDTWIGLKTAYDLDNVRVSVEGDDD